MTRTWQEILDRTVDPERQAASWERAQAALAQMALGELRRARELTQAELAGELGKGQAAVSRMERRADVYVSTLRRYVEALGGTLEIVARFPDGAVKISQFADGER